MSTPPPRPPARPQSNVRRSAEIFRAAIDKALAEGFSQKEMLLRLTYGLGTEANAIETAIETVLQKGYRTPDLYESGMTKLGTSQMGDAVIAQLQS